MMTKTNQEKKMTTMTMTTLVWLLADITPWILLHLETSVASLAMKIRRMVATHQVTMIPTQILIPIPVIWILTMMRVLISTETRDTTTMKLEMKPIRILRQLVLFGRLILQGRLPNHTSDAKLLISISKR